MRKNTLAIMPSVLALAIGMALPAAQAYAAVTTESAIVGSESQWWNTYKVTLTNNGSTAIELREAKIVFDSNISMSTPSWSANAVSYPGMQFASNANGSAFKNTLVLSFDNGSWVKTQLKAGDKIELTLGVSGKLDLALLQNSIELIADGEVGEPELSLQLASPVNGAEFVEGNNVAMLANVTANNTTVESVKFFVDNKQVANVTKAPYQANWKATGEGNHTIKAIVEDASGLTQEQSARITVKAEEVDEPEISLQLASPVNGAEFEEGQKVALLANVTATNTTVKSVKFFVDGTQVASATKSPFQTTWTATGEGQHIVKALVEDVTGLTQEQSVRISVNAEEVTPPSDLITFIPGQTQVNNGDMVIYAGECFVAKNNPGVWETPSAGSWFWDAVECPGEPEGPVVHELSFVAPTQGQSVTVDEATVIQARVDGEQIAKVEFWANGVKLNTQNIDENTTSYSQAWTPGELGNATLRIVVLDQNNQTVAQESVTVLVESEGETEDPVVRELSFVSPTQGQTLNVDESTVIQARVEGEYISTLEFWAGNNKLGQQNIVSSTEAYSLAWTPREAGNTTLKLVVRGQNNQIVEQQTISVNVESDQEGVSPEVAFITPSNGAKFDKGQAVSISVRASDVDGDLSSVVVKANNEQVCQFDATATQQFTCDWTASEAEVVTLETIATDAQNLTARASVQITIEEIITQPPEGLCADFNVYPNWTQPTNHAAAGDIMVHENIAYTAKYYTTSIPGSDDSWKHHLNCDGTEAGTAPLLSLRNPLDPVRLEVNGWPNTLVVASPSTSAPAHTVVDVANRDELANVETLTAAFVSLITTAESAGSSTIVINSDVLEHATADKGQSLGTIAVKQALTAAIDQTGSDIDISAVNALSDDAKGWAQAHNLVLTTLAPAATFGWTLSIGDFAYDNHSGRQSVWDEASQYSADLLAEFELYDAKSANKADFIAFNKSGATAALTADQWHNALEYVKQVSDHAEVPAMLANVPTAQAATYFMGETAGERQVRKAAYSNVFAILFDQDNAQLTEKIARYQDAKVPLYYVGENANDGPLTIIDELNRQLADAEHEMNNEAFKYETPTSGWVPSTVYKWADFLDGVNAMHNVGVAGNKFWLLDESVDEETNIKYAKVAIAAFLAQSMQETIRYNACDENNWAMVDHGAPTNYPMSASCGQLGQDYADYGFNPATGRDHAFSCPRDNKMEVSALTSAKWYGAPAPVFAAPDAVLEERGLLKNGAVGRWDYGSNHCNDGPNTAVDTSKQVWERESCKVYKDQQAGQFIWDGSSQRSVEGCGWWGRGVIQTTGRQNFGTLNHYLGRSHVDPDTIGTTIDGVKVEAPPANPLYANLDFCSNPGLICSSEENAEIKWIAGLFYWVTSVQAYSNEGGPYADWNYYNELKQYVDGGMTGTNFIDDVSGIVNRGCPDLSCSTGAVHNVAERRENFKVVLNILGLDPK